MVALQDALAERARTGSPAATSARLLGGGDGWTVHDVMCTRGPDDRAFEEEHPAVAIAVVAAGSFQYRSTAGRELMAPGSLLLGNARDGFECGHEHGSGDRCIAFRYSADYFDRLFSDAAMRSTKQRFAVPRLPPVPALSPIVARACAALSEALDGQWEEIALQIAAQTTQVARGVSNHRTPIPAGALSRVTDIVRQIDRGPASEHRLGRLAHDAGLSPYHFLRTFERLVGVTPHQYVLRLRLREAAARLTAEPDRIVDIAFACGFGDLSNFNRAFRREFGVSPRAFRAPVSSRSAFCPHAEPAV